MKTALYLLTAATLVFSTAKAGNDCDSTKCSKGMNIHIDDNQTHKYWEGLDIGFSGWLTPQRSLELSEGWKTLEIDNARSFAFAWNIHQHNFHIYKNYVNLATGLGLEWNSYAFQNNILLDKSSDQLTGTIQPIDYSKNKLRTCFVNVPVMLDFNSSENENKAFHVSAGMKFGYNIFRNRQVVKYYEPGNDDKQKDVYKDDFNVNPIRYSLAARVGYGDYTLFADYALSDMFRTGKGPKVNPFTVGLRVSL